MRTIALISEHASPLAVLGGVDSGGQNVYVAQVARQLARLGNHVDIFTRRDQADLPEICNWTSGVRVIHVPAGPAEYIRKEDLLGYMQEFSAYMIDFLRRQDRPYDIVHANFWMSGLVAANIKAVLGTPFVITFHALGQVRRQYQGRNDDFPSQRFDAEQRIVREADGIVAECPQDRDDLIHLYAADPAKLREIPCGFDPHELWPINKRAAQSEIGLHGEEWVVLQLGRMVPRKGVDTAIRGFAGMARRSGIRARMLVVGGALREPDPRSTPEIARLQEIAAEEGVLDQVTFSGRRTRNELKFYYSAADVFISTPWYEPFGITPVEAMACGTPVIGARVGGIQHTVVDGETGYLVPARDPLAIADRLIELHEDRAKLERFRQNALQRVNEKFTWSKVGEALGRFYEDSLVAQPYELGSITLRGQRPAAHGQQEHSVVIARGFDSALETLERSRRLLNTSIARCAQLLIDCLQRGGKVLICGNGGSAADAQHFAAELVGRFNISGRRGLPILALTADTAFLTAWANDVGFEQVFARQVEALGHPGDILVGISTSGRSRNVVAAFQKARAAGMKCVALLGGDGGDLLPLADAAALVPSESTQRIQEIHTLVMHTLCELVEMHAAPGAIEPLTVAPTALALALSNSH